jgi:hypothetical protein
VGEKNGSETVSDGALPSGRANSDLRALLTRLQKIGPFSRVPAPDSTIALAPAAGAGVGKLLADRLLGRPDFLDTMEAVAARALSATARRWDPGAKEWIVEPDMRTQSGMFFGLLAHMEGEPIKRIIHQHLGGNGSVDPLAALQESPALRDAARRLLEKADWRTSGHQEHKRPKAAQPVLEVE